MPQHKQFKNILNLKYVESFHSFMTDRTGERGGASEEAKENPVSRLLRNLTTTAPARISNRVLTCVIFGEHTPVLVVGDAKGCVTVYRVLEPNTILHQGLKIIIFIINPAILTHNFFW